MYKKNAKKMSTNEKLEKFLKEVEAREHKELTNLRASGPREDEYDVLRRSRLYKVATSDRLALHSPGKVSKGSPVRDGIKDFPTRDSPNKPNPFKQSRIMFFPRRHRTKPILPKNQLPTHPWFAVFWRESNKNVSLC